jgi:ubiquitin-protein ligase
MNPRVRRLLADADAIRTEFAGHPYISVTAIGPEPAESYRVTFNLRGATLDARGQPIMANQHRAVIQLTATYPREKPLAVSETMVFHPNFAGHAGGEICIGDFWTPTRTLTDIVVAIGEMLQYQRYNTKSPLNAVAARWAVENEVIFPLGNIGLFQSEPEISLGTPRGEAPGIAVALDDGPDVDPEDVGEGRIAPPVAGRSAGTMTEEALE